MNLGVWGVILKLLDLAQNGRWRAALTVVSFFLVGYASYYGKDYVDKKHSEGIVEIEKAKKSILKIDASQLEVSETMIIIRESVKHMDKSLTSIEGAVKRLDAKLENVQNRVLDIYDRERNR